MFSYSYKEILKDVSKTDRLECIARLNGVQVQKGIDTGLFFLASLILFTQSYFLHNPYRALFICVGFFLLFFMILLQVLYNNFKGKILSEYVDVKYEAKKNG